MASSSAELRKALKNNGWTLFREGTKHYVYAKGKQTLLIPMGNHIYSRTYKQILLKIQGKTDRSRNRLPQSS